MQVAKQPQTLCLRNIIGLSTAKRGLQQLLADGIQPEPLFVHPSKLFLRHCDALSLETCAESGAKCTDPLARVPLDLLVVHGAKFPFSIQRGFANLVRPAKGSAGVTMISSLVSGSSMDSSATPASSDGSNSSPRARTTPCCLKAQRAATLNFLQRFKVKRSNPPVHLAAKLPPFSRIPCPRRETIPTRCSRLFLRSKPSQQQGGGKGEGLQKATCNVQGPVRSAFKQKVEPSHSKRVRTKKSRSSTKA